MEKEEKDFIGKLSEVEKVRLRVKAYELALRIPIIDGYTSKSEWIDFKSREIYNWLLKANPNFRLNIEPIFYIHYRSLRMILLQYERDVRPSHL